MSPVTETKQNSPLAQQRINTQDSAQHPERCSFCIYLKQLLGAEQRAQVLAAAWCRVLLGPMLSCYWKRKPGSLFTEGSRKCQKHTAGNTIPLPRKRGLKITSLLEGEGKFHTSCLLQVGVPKIKLLGLTASGHLSISLGNRLVKSQQT